MYSPNVIFLAAGVLYSFLFLAWTQYEYDFSLISNNISRLGRPSMNPDGFVYSFIGTSGSAILMLGYYHTLFIWKTEDQKLNKAISILTILGYIACALLVGIAIFHSDYKLTHKILGGMYFGMDIILMLLGMYVATRHPKIDTFIIYFCILSALLDILYLQSDAKWSWAEWGSVAMSFVVGGWLAINSRRLPIRLDNHNNPEQSQIAS